MNPFVRLQAALIAANVPILGVRGTGAGDAAIDYAPAATAPQRAQGASILAAHDWSLAADAAFVAAQGKEEASSAVDAWLLQGASASTGDRVLVGFALLVLDEINTLRGFVALPAYTEQQLVDAVKAKIAARSN